MKKQATNEMSKTLKLYQSIHKLPLHIFIDCLVSQQYYQLVIEGKATIQEMEQAFESLYMQYVESAGGKEAVNQMVNTARTALIKFRVETFELLVNTIKLEPSEDLYKLFEQYPQYNPILKEYSLEAIDYTIGQMIPHWKSERIDLMNELDYIELQKKEKGQKTSHYSYEYFNSILAELESVFKTATISDEMTVGKFCTWLNKYKEHVKIMNKQNEQ